MRYVKQVPERSAPAYLLAGFRLLREPDIAPFFIAPLLVNITVFSLAIVWSANAFSAWIDSALRVIPSWLSFLEWILWPLFIAGIVLVVFYGFTLISNLIGAPFNGLLAERVAARMRARKEPAKMNVSAFLATIPASLLRECRKLLYFAMLAIGVGLIALIPITTPIAPALWFLVGSWTLVLEYCDYQADNDGVKISELKGRLRKFRGKSLGFGATTMLATMVPILNLAVMPAAVCGATMLWVEILDGDD